MLERIDLITRVNTEENYSNAKVKVWEDENTPFQKLRIIHYTFEPSSIVIFPQLREFVDRGFVTLEEQQIIEERTARKRQEKITIGISLGIFIATVIIQILFQTTERNVLIKNPKDFSDTVKVLFLNPPTQLITDSLQTKLLKDSLQNTSKK